MRILRFNESKENEDIQVIIKEYFASFEDMEDICTLEFKKINDTYFKIKIRLKNSNTKIKQQYYIKSESDLFILDNHIINNTNDNKILTELKASLNGLINDDVLEDFNISRQYAIVPASYILYEIKIWTKVSGDYQQWVFINDYHLLYDKVRLKQLIKDKFNIEIISSILEEDYDRYNDRYIRFGIEFEKGVNLTDKDKISEWILSTNDLFNDEVEWIFQRIKGNENTLLFDVNLELEID